MQGVTVWVVPAKPPVMNTRYYGLRVVKSSAHRVMCMCSECGKTVSLGRLAQHAKIHDKESATAKELRMRSNFGPGNI